MTVIVRNWCVVFDENSVKFYFSSFFNSNNKFVKIESDLTIENSAFFY